MRLRIVELTVCAGIALGIVLATSACSETWRGAKQDTKDNVESVGKGVEKAGEKIQDSVK
jgi:predicted small secreted protein